MKVPAWPFPRALRQFAVDIVLHQPEVELLGEMARTTISKEAWRDQMQRLKASSPAFVWIGVTDNLGTVEVATDGLLEGMSIATRGVFANAVPSTSSSRSLTR